jgi:hypothetical protein
VWVVKCFIEEVGSEAESVLFTIYGKLEVLAQNETRAGVYKV